MNVLPKISIVTPSFNQGEFIESTIRSVIGQGYPNLEYIIIDGGSTDGTVEIIKKYEAQLTYWISEPDKGQSDALNKGFSKATGELFYWINSDDYLVPNVLHKIGRYNWTKNLGAVVGIGHIINLNKQVIYTPKYYDPITTKDLFEWNDGKDFMQPACFFTKTAWDNCGPLNSELYFCMDVDLWIKISKKFKIQRINEVIAHAYGHEEAKTTSEEDRMRLETYLMIASHGGFEPAKIGLERFYHKSTTKRLTSDQVLEEFTFKKLLKLSIKKLRSTLSAKK